MNDDIYLKLYDRILMINPYLALEDGIILPEDEFELMGFASVDILELILWAEQEFNIYIAGADVQDIKTVAEFADHIEELKYPPPKERI